MHVPCSEEAPVAVQLVLVFLDFSAPAFGLVPTINRNATDKTFSAAAVVLLVQRVYM